MSKKGFDPLPMACISGGRYLYYTRSTIAVATIDKTAQIMHINYLGLNPGTTTPFPMEIHTPKVPVPR